MTGVVRHFANLASWDEDKRRMAAGRVALAAQKSLGKPGKLSSIVVLRARRKEEI
jgi:hypothetical protein